MLSILLKLKEAGKSFIRESHIQITTWPFIRDFVDLKRWMALVVFSLIPCTLAAILNNGLLSVVYKSHDMTLLKSYLSHRDSFGALCSFVLQEHLLLKIIYEGLIIFLPILIICYTVGGIWEVLFATVRKKEVSEGFFVTGLLIALILPSTIPYWMIVVGVSLGIVISKELFGGTGYNIYNPALICRCILYFAYPSFMTGDVWVGTNPQVIQHNIQEIKKENHAFDIISTESPLVTLANNKITRLQVDAIGMLWNNKVSLRPLLQTKLYNYDKSLKLGSLSPHELQQFVTSPNGLDLAPDQYSAAMNLAKLQFSHGVLSNSNLFFGSQIGSLGETSKIAIIIGALLLLITGVASIHSMLAVAVGALLTSYAFYAFSHLGPLGGAFNPAIYALTPYKHFLLGGLLFGLVFMATEPVTSPYATSAKWIYGLIIGFLTIIIRLINPAYPEGVMLAILFGNTISPLLDHAAITLYRRRARVR